MSDSAPRLKAKTVSYSFVIKGRKIADVNKFGHKFARKKRQMKKNKKRYGLLWKVAREYTKDTKKEIKRMRDYLEGQCLKS